MLLPILFGPLGFVLGIVELAKGSRGLGVAAIIVSVVGFVVGIILGALLLSLTKGA